MKLPWRYVNGEDFELTYQLLYPHFLYCDVYDRLRQRKIEVAGTLEFLEAEGYLFSPRFAPLVEQGYRVTMPKS